MSTAEELDARVPEGVELGQVTLRADTLMSCLNE